MKKDIWMGLINISPQAGNGELNVNEEAYTTVFLYADDAEEYEEQVKSYLNAEKFNILSIEDVASYTPLEEEYEFDEDMEEAVEFLESTKKPQMTVLNIYKKED